MAGCQLWPIYAGRLKLDDIISYKRREENKKKKQSTTP